MNITRSTDSVTVTSKIPKENCSASSLFSIHTKSHRRRSRRDDANKPFRSNEAKSLLSPVNNFVRGSVEIN